MNGTELNKNGQVDKLLDGWENKIKKRANE